MNFSIDFDVETTGLQWYWDELFLAQFGEGEYDGSEMVVPIYHYPDDRGAIEDWLAVQADEFWAWNSKFDLHFLDSAGFKLPPENTWNDGMVLAQLTDETYSAALKARAERMYGVDERDPEKMLKGWLGAEEARRRKAWKGDLYDWLEAQGYPQKRNKLPQVPPGLALPDEIRFVRPNYSDVPWEIMEPYAKQDIVLTRRIVEALRPVVPPRVREIYQLEMDTMVALYHMEKRGLPVNEQLANALVVDSANKLSELEREVRELVGKKDFNPNAPQQVARALEHAGADLRHVPRSSKTKQYRMDEEVLQAIDHPIAAAVLKFRAEYKMLSTYGTPLIHPHEDRGYEYKPWIGPDGHVHTQFLQVGARSGRMSSSSPNIQNWPRDDLRMRYLVEADREGEVLVAADMQAIEARLLAMYAGPGRLLATFRQGGDIHALTAKMIGLKDRQRSTGVEPARQRGKKFNYLKGYQGGSRAIKKWFFVSDQEAAEMNRRYYDAYPEIARLNDKIQIKLARQGYIETMWGRRQRLEDDPMALRKFGYKYVAYLNQGTAADMIKMAMVKLHKQGVPLLGIFHDEVLAQVPEKDAPEVAHMMQEALTDFPEITAYVPLEAEADIVHKWSEAKDPEFVPSYATKTRRKRNGKTSARKS